MALLRFSVLLLFYRDGKIRRGENVVRLDDHVHVEPLILGKLFRGPVDSLSIKFEPVLF